MQVLIGQNPGEEEDHTGRPFLGRTGRYLDKVLEKVGLTRENIFIHSQAQDSIKQETGRRRDTLLPFLLQQIDEIRPDIIVLKGKVAERSPRFEGIRYREPPSESRYGFPRFENQMRYVKSCYDRL